MANVLDFIITAKDATRAGVRGAVRNLRLVAAAGRQAGRAVFGAFKGLGSFIFRQARRAAIGFAVATVAALKFASDAEEAANKFQVVFGDATESVIKDLDRFAQRTGLSSTRLQSFAGDIGDVAKALGFEGDALGKLSSDLVKLAVDTASFKNAQVPDVIAAFTSALAGERESLKSLGVVITEADVKQEALNKGLKRGKKDLDTITKAAVTYSLLIDRLADSQGDAERTSGSFANRVKQVRDAMFEAGVEFGKQLIAGGKLNDVLGRVSQAIAGFVARLRETKAVEEFAAKARQTLGEIAGFVERLFAGGAISQQAVQELRSLLEAVMELAANKFWDIMNEGVDQFGKSLALGLVGLGSRERVRRQLQISEEDQQGGVTARAPRSLREAFGQALRPITGAGETIGRQSVGDVGLAAQNLRAQIDTIRSSTAQSQSAPQRPDR